MPRVTEGKSWKNIGSGQEARAGSAEWSAVFAGEPGAGGDPWNELHGNRDLLDEVAR